MHGVHAIKELGGTVAEYRKRFKLRYRNKHKHRKRSEVELMKAIEVVMHDTSWFSRTVVEKLANLRQPHGSNKADVGLKDLTSREREVLGLICQGLTNQDIAKQLGVSRNTIRNQIAAS